MNETEQNPRRISHELEYETFRAKSLAMDERQFLYGKWVLTSCITLNGGSLVAITQAGDKASSLYQASGLYLIIGLALAVIAGAIAWINFSIASVIWQSASTSYARNTAYEMGKGSKWAMIVTLYIAALLGLASIGMFSVAACKSISIL